MNTLYICYRNCSKTTIENQILFFIFYYNKYCNKYCDKMRKKKFNYIYNLKKNIS